MKKIKSVPAKTQLNSDVSAMKVSLCH